MSLAKGISGEDPFLVIDTESRRALHYADQFHFDHIDFEPPFTPERYLEAVRLGEAKGYLSILIDSMSHEYDGEGGITEMAETSSLKGPAAWKDPKMRHKKMVNAFLQIRSHLIFCLRAEEKIDMSKKDDRGRVIVESAGWQPICEKRFPYEMTASFTMNPTAPGVVDLSLPHKLQDQHRMSFLPGQHVSVESGQMLAKWAKGETIETPDKELWDRARRVAQEGMDRLKTFYFDVCDDDMRARLKPIGGELNETAKRVDKNRGALE